MPEPVIVSQTASLCPQCLQRLPADVVRRGDEVWLERTCPEHGETSALVWRGPPDYGEWCRSGAGASCCRPPENPACPTACGLCEGHARGTCCVLLEVTARCDLQCPVCFAGSSREAPEDPSMEAIEGWYRRLLDTAPGCNVQLSGGEPTVRDDLPEVIALGRSLGLRFFQLNTNGIRLAAEDGYTERLADAGLDTVFLQFDGVDDEPYLALRGRRLAAVKERAIERCAAAGIGVVLVPTVTRGVNLHRLGAILDFALDRLPVVRGVHLQPLALLGRYPDPVAAGETRVTLPDVMRALAAQSGGRIRLEDLRPGDCEHALCSFSREYLRRADGSLAPLGDDGSCGGKRAIPCGCDSGGAFDAGAAASPSGVLPEDKAAHVARRWSAPEGGCCEAPTVRVPLHATAAAATGPRARGPAPDDQWSRILRDIRGNTFSVSGMAFQDAWTVDLERLRHCYLHVVTKDRRVVPFCAYNLTAVDGHGLPGGRESDGLDVTAGAGRAVRPSAPASAPRETERRDEPHRAGCMVCGAALVYSTTEAARTCHYCGRVVAANAECATGHFVCDTCHRANAVEVIQRVCLESRETDPVVLMQTIRSHPRFAVHGPEHHPLIPAVILAALRNAGHPVSDDQIETAIRRGQTIAGGSCAFIGACGAAIGAGIAVSILLGADPLAAGKRRRAQVATQTALAAIASLDAARCCQRDSWLALEAVAGLVSEWTGAEMAVSPIVCAQSAENAECIGESCPLWPASLR